ncbi:MAG: hypothetical protein KF799_07305 [Bdellovibrionales bacterium]|nr:hypothetical protein [Bdellovibrionales bacterium]
MKDKIRAITLLTTIISVLSSCSLVKKKQFNEFGVKEFTHLRVGVDSKESLRGKLGTPDESHSDQWIYYLRGTPRLSLVFENDNLSSASWSIWEGDSIEDIKTLLEEFRGNWRVIREPMVSPHAAPHLCYLEDLKNGKRAEVHGYTKKVSELTIWRAATNDRSIKDYLIGNLGKEFCIAGHCSKATDSSTWEHNHCEWLEQLLSEKAKNQ